MRHKVNPAPALALTLFLAGCGDAIQDDHFANEIEIAEAPAEPVRHVVPVRIGELGPSFDACIHAGTTRHVRPEQRLPVRAAPFEEAEEVGAIPADGRFFVCARSQDQKWLGIVWNEGEGLSESCGVSSPVASRRSYEGPCRSGWAPSALVKLIAG